ncbi:MAG: hypothetical protein K2Z81_01690, partial [Cyanobacteria bacterium]|nr:hypothetical protein [Cyanobacteriota bacterium]
MDDLIRTIQSVKDEAKPHPEISSSLKRLEKGVKALRKTAKSALADFPQSGFLNLLSKFKGSGKITANMEDTLFEILHSENAVLDSSYELGTQVRNEVLFLIVLCAVANLFLLSFLAYTGIKILSKIQILAGKADAFAAGNNLSPSIKGKDELNYLDESLCEVANSIRQAEARRTELLAVINHDLRTPLGSILAGLELIQSGIASDSPANLNELFDQVEAELQTLLEQINNLLLLEKLDTGSLKLDTASVDLSELLEEAVAEANR